MTRVPTIDPAENPQPHDESTPRLALVWLWLASYIVVFFLWPLGSARPGSAVAGSRIYLWQFVLVADQFIGDWFAGFSLRSVVERAGLVLVAGAILTVALAAGWLLLRLVRLDRVLSQFEMSLFALFVGMNVVSLATLSLGLAGLLRREAFALAGLIPCVAAGLLYWRRGCASRPLANESCPGVLGRRWLWLAAPFVGAILLSGLLPPTDFDVREYHLQAPKEFFLNGRIDYLPHNVYANMPLGAEMFSLAAMVLTGDWFTGALAGKLLIACFTPLTALALYAAGLRLATPTAGIVAALVYVSTPWIASVSAGGLIEGVFAGYWFAALLALLIWNQQAKKIGLDANAQPGIGLLALAGFLAGAAAGTKYPAVLYVVLPLAAIVVAVAWARAGKSQSTSRALAGTFAPLAVFLAAVVAGGGLWYAKNAALTGNPTYPLLNSVFTAGARSPEIEARWQRAHAPPNFEPQDFVERTFRALIGSDLLSPLLVSLAGLAWLVRPARRLTLFLTGYVAFVFLAWWCFTHRIDRFLVPVLPLVALLAGIGATWSSTRVWRNTLVGLLGVGLAYNLLLLTSGGVADNRYLAPLSSLRNEPRRVLPWRQYFNERANEVHALLLVGDAQPFDLDVPTTYNTVFDPLVFEQLAKDKSPEQVRAALIAHGLSHVHVAWNEINRYRSPGNYGFSDFVQPRVFDDLVKAGVLEPIADFPDDQGQAFRVKPGK